MWIEAVTALDGGAVHDGCWADDLEEFLGAGANAGLSIIRAENGIDWTSVTTPFDGGVGRGAVRKLGTTIAGPLMKADASIADAYAEIDLGAGHAEVWATCKLVFDGVALRAWTLSSSGYFCWLVEPDWASSYISSGTWPDSSRAFPQTEHLIELHLLEGSAFEVYVDGTLVESDDDSGDDGPVRTIRFGQSGGYTAPGSVGYLKDIVVGTTRGDNDLFDANIAGGNLDAFTSTSGAVSVVDDLTFPALYVAAGLSADTRDSIITSPDGTSASWTGRGNPFYSYGYANGTAVRESDGALLAIGGGYALPEQLGISTNGGVDWTRYQPFDAGANALCVAVRQSDDLIIAGGSSNFGYYDEVDIVAVSADGAATWSTSNPFGPNGRVSAIAVRESDGAIVVLGSDATATGLKVAISTDDGATWTVVTAPFVSSDTAPYKCGIAVRQSDDAIIVAGCSSQYAGAEQVSITTDGGTTWTASSPFGATGYAYTVAVRQGDDAIVVGGSNDDFDLQFAITADSAATWTPYNLYTLPTDEGLFYCSALAVRESDGAILAYGATNGSGGNLLLVSTDDGATWVALGAPLGDSGSVLNGVSIRPADDAILVGASPSPGNTQTAVSLDAGSSFVTGSPFSVSYSAMCVACKQATGRVLAGGPSAAYYGPLMYSDGGEVWPADAALSPPLGDVVGIDYSPGTDVWMAADSGSVAKSSDDGANWDVVFYMPLIARVYRDEDNARWWLLGQTDSGKAAAYSDDDGATWTEVETPLDPIDGVGQANAVRNCGGATLAMTGISANGERQMCASDDAGSSWHLDDDPAPLGSGGAGAALAYSPTLARAVVFGSSA